MINYVPSTGPNSFLRFSLIPAMKRSPTEAARRDQRTLTVGPAYSRQPNKALFSMPDQRNINQRENKYKRKRSDTNRDHYVQKPYVGLFGGNEGEGTAMDGAMKDLKSTEALKHETFERPAIFFFFLGNKAEKRNRV